MHIAKRMSRLGTETAFEVFARAKALEAQGKNIIHLELGEPDFITPKNIREAAKKALDEGYTKYTPAPGIPVLRETIAAYISRTRDIKVSASEVVVTPGAKPIMFYGLLACVDEGDEVIYPNPGFPIYESVIDFIGAKSVPLPLLEEKAFSFSIDDLKSRITSKTRMLIINSPHNPTGGILTKEDILQIAELAKKHNFIVLADEIYSRVVYDGFVPFSITAVPGMKERTILLDGFSKTYAMTGWRLGWGVMPEEIAVLVTKLMINSNSCTNAAAQMGGLEALRGPQEEADMMVAEFKRRRDVLVEGLNKIPGMTCLKPHGAFYVFPNVKKVGKSSKELADYFMNDAGVACLSGTAFGKYGDGYIRFSYANSLENIQEALKRIDVAVRKIAK
jgi:aspartate/methionine/tyrosine aminotransferase